VYIVRNLMKEEQRKLEDKNKAKESES